MSKISKQSIEKTSAKKAAIEAKARQAALELEEDEEIAFASEQELDDELEEALEQEEDFSAAEAAIDVFEKGEKFTKQGIPIKYIVKRNGELKCTKYHPFSWDQIQKEFGGGQYHIVAKTVSDNRYKAQETLSLSDIGENVNKIEKEIKEPAYSQAATVPTQPSFIEMFTLMNKISEDKNREIREASAETARQARESAQSKSSDSTSFMMAFLEMNKSSAAQAQVQAQQTSSMMLELAKMQQVTSEKLAESQRLMFDKMESRFEKIITAISDNDKNKEKPIDPLKLYEMMSKSKTEGFELFSKFTELAEAKAEEKIAAMEDKEEASHEPKPTMIDRLIEGVLPVVAGALAAKQAPVAAPAQLPIPQPRRSLPPRADSRNRNVQPNTRNNQAQGQAPRAQGNERVSIESSGSRASSREPTPQVANTASGLASVDFEAVPARILDQKIDKIANIEDNRQTGVDEMTNILANTLGECYMKQLPSHDSGDLCVETLKESGITVETFLQKFTGQDMIKLVETFQLTDDAKVWFNNLYANIKARARVDAR